MPRQPVNPAVDEWTCGFHGGHTKGGALCRQPAIAGTKRCKLHGGISKAKAKAKGAVVVELQKWGLGDSTVDPGETLLRLVTQSAARCDRYAQLLGEAYDAAERLKAGREAGELVEVGGDGTDADRAREDLKRIFTTGGVAALVGNVYAATKDGDIYATGEAIRGLAKLEAEERDRCATMATKAVAAGLAERQVRLAEQQGTLLASVIRAVLDDLDLSPEQAAKVAEVVPRHLRAVA
jgi:hypothetical protein